MVSEWIKFIKYYLQIEGTSTTPPAIISYSYSPSSLCAIDFLRVSYLKKYFSLFRRDLQQTRYRLCICSVLVWWNCQYMPTTYVKLLAIFVRCTYRRFLPYLSYNATESVWEKIPGTLEWESLPCFFLLAVLWNIVKRIRMKCELELKTNNASNFQVNSPLSKQSLRYCNFKIISQIYLKLKQPI